MQFAIKLEDLGGEYMATCEDIPEFVTTADDIDGIVVNAVDAMQVALSAYVDERRPVPAFRTAMPDEHTVTLPALTSAKVSLYRAMHERGVSKGRLARLLGVHGPQVDRMLDLTHGSKIEAIEHALAVLGFRILLDVQRAA
jgi:antitoxin HicB